jgi:hypothetical protein
MSRLSDLYKAMETLRKEGLSLNDDLERQVSELEENIIKKEILPVVTETIEPALKQVQRELPGLRGYSPSSMKNMRKFYESWIMLDANSSVATDELENSTIANVEMNSSKSAIANVGFLCSRSWKQSRPSRSNII